jgi:hypothetical protein
VPQESGYDWAMMTPQERAAFVIRKYGINLRGSGQTFTVRNSGRLLAGLIEAHPLSVGV